MTEILKIIAPSTNSAAAAAAEITGDGAEAGFLASAALNGDAAGQSAADTNHVLAALETWLSAQSGVTADLAEGENAPVEAYAADVGVAGDLASVAKPPEQDAEISSLPELVSGTVAKLIQVEVIERTGAGSASVSGLEFKGHGFGLEKVTPSQTATQPDQQPDNADDPSPPEAWVDTRLGEASALRLEATRSLLPTDAAQQQWKAVAPAHNAVQESAAALQIPELAAPLGRQVREQQPDLPVAPAGLGRPMQQTRIEGVSTPRRAEPAPEPEATPDERDITLKAIARAETYSPAGQTTLPAATANQMGFAQLLDPALTGAGGDGLTAEVPALPVVDAEAPARPAATATELRTASPIQHGHPPSRQMADALVISRGETTEILLSPDELGRVRMVMGGPDRAQLVIWAERADTLDLLRRNADSLGADLAAAGFGSASMEFREGGAWKAPQEAEIGDHAEASPAVLQPLPMAHRFIDPQRRIDIRV